MDIDPKRHKEEVLRSYAARAKVYDTRMRPGENVSPMIDLAMPRESDRMLDVACGGGLVSLAFAPLVKTVVGVDLSPDMIEIARRLADERGVTNADFIVGDAEKLRFGPGLFDLVTCRSAFHHLVQAERALHEMARVLAPKGRIVLYDLVASDQPKKAERQNEIMRMRDPSHVRVLSPAEWTDFIRRCGLHVDARVVVMMKREFDDWMDVAAADAQRRAQVREALLESMEGDRAGLGVRQKGDRITFSQTCGIWTLSK